MTRIDSSNTQAMPLPPNESGLLTNRTAESIAAQLGGGPEALIAAIALKVGTERSQQANRQRAQVEAHINEVQAEQIQEMREQADALRNGAVFGAIGGVIEGGLNIAAGEALQNGERATSAMREGGADVAGAFGGLGKGWFDAEAADEAAQGQAAENRADAGIRQLQTVQEHYDGGRDLGNKALDFLQNVRETQAQMGNSLTVRG